MFQNTKAQLGKAKIEDDLDLIKLNNEAVVAFQNHHFDRAVEIFYSFYDIVESHPWSYFNYLILCWQAGIYTDDFVFRELEQSTTATSYLFGLVYEAQNNWWAAKANYQLAIESATDGTYSELKKRLDRTQQMAEKYNENFLFGHLEHSDVSSIRLSFNGKLAASF